MHGKSPRASAASARGGVLRPSPWSPRPSRVDFSAMTRSLGRVRRCTSRFTHCMRSENDPRATAGDDAHHIELDRPRTLPCSGATSTSPGQVRTASHSTMGTSCRRPAQQRGKGGSRAACEHVRECSSSAARPIDGESPPFRRRAVRFSHERREQRERSGRVVARGCNRRLRPPCGQQAPRSTTRSGRGALGGDAGGGFARPFSSGAVGVGVGAGPAAGVDHAHLGHACEGAGPRRASYLRDNPIVTARVCARARDGSVCRAAASAASARYSRRGSVLEASSRTPCPKPITLLRRAASLRPSGVKEHVRRRPLPSITRTSK